MIKRRKKLVFDYQIVFNKMELVTIEFKMMIIMLDVYQTVMFIKTE